MKKRFPVIFGIGLAVLFGGCRGDEPAIKPSPDDKPFMALDQVSSELDEIFHKDFDGERNVTGEPAAFTLANRCFVLQAEYWILFREYLDRLPAAEARKALEENRVFLEREKKLSEEAGREFEGGSLEPIVAGRKTIELYEARIARLKAAIEEPKRVGDTI